MGMTHDATRRELLKKAAYVAPMVLTLQATSAVAKSGSEKGQPGQEAKEAEEAEEAEQKVDAHGVTRDTFFALHERNPALIG